MKVKFGLSTNIIISLIAGIACGIFGLEALGGMGGVTFASQFVGSIGGALFGLAAGLFAYTLVDVALGFRLSPAALGQVLRPIQGQHLARDFHERVVPLGEFREFRGHIT